MNLVFQDVEIVGSKLFGKLLGAGFKYINAYHDLMLMMVPLISSKPTGIVP